MARMTILRSTLRAIGPDRRRRLGAVLVVVAVGFASGSGAAVSLATLTSSATLGSNAFTTAASFDTVAPTVSTTVIAKTGQYDAGFIRQGGTYLVYANATDGGVVPSGIATITADVSAITSGATAVSLVPGSFSVEGVAYGYRSASLTANNPLAAGSKTYTLTSTDNNANSRLQTGYAVTVDNTAPTGTDIQTANGGASVGRIELGDTVTYTFSEVIDPESILAGWTGTSTSVVVRFTDSGNSDAFAVWNAANTTQLSLGSVNTSGNYVTTAVTAGAGGTASTMVLDPANKTITITLGTIAGTVNMDNGNRTSVWTPSASAFDRAGNAMSTTVVNESGANDKDF
jgi:hypothetical protein